jgi:hypothetical protein
MINHSDISPSAPLKRFLPFGAAGLALVLGGIFAVSMSGLGEASRPALGLIVVALIAAVVISWLGAVLLQTRWLAAVLFSAPIAAGLPFAAISHQWSRCFALLACVILPFAVVGLFRFDHRRS